MSKSPKIVVLLEEKCVISIKKPSVLGPVEDENLLVFDTMRIGVVVVGFIYVYLFLK
jgi:hypothetical protein